MNIYNIEGNIDFYAELHKHLNEDSDVEDSNDICKITGSKLTDKYVTLECNHSFNYVPLYNELYAQKIQFKTYDASKLPKQELIKFYNSKSTHFIKCPYCRNIEFSVLPYYEELGLEAIYGINSLDKTLPTYVDMRDQLYDSDTDSDDMGSVDLIDLNGKPTYYYYGRPIIKGVCCGSNVLAGVIHIPCKEKHVIKIAHNEELYYCPKHFQYGMKKYACQLKQKKMEMMDAKKKQLEAINLEREKNGKKPLQKLPQKAALTSDGENVKGCSAILKSGTNKGKPCGCSTLANNTVCKRHLLTNVIQK